MSVTVLLSLAPPDGTTRYVCQLVDGRAEGVTYKFFSWKTALLGRYDLFHVHWPEHLLRATTPLRRLVRRLLFRLLLLRLHWSHRAVVRTLHNLQPHEAVSPAEARLLCRLDAGTTLFIYLNASVPMASPNCVVIPLGHYRGRYPAAIAPTVERGRLLSFGIIRPYKGVDRLLEVFHRVEDPTLSLRVVGKPTPGWRAVVERACERDPRISAVLDFVPDDVLAQEICKAELVVLPFREMYNSGTMLLALSLDRPVLAPRTPANELLNDEVGPGWIHLYDGELTAVGLVTALHQVRAIPRQQRPRLSQRDWATVGLRHREAYLRALGGAPVAPVNGVGVVAAEHPGTRYAGVLRQRRPR
jgi:beta-1,4-mannosyltransferase